jgi:hypothetical protein
MTSALSDALDRHVRYAEMLVSSVRRHYRHHYLTSHSH